MPALGSRRGTGWKAPQGGIRLESVPSLPLRGPTFLVCPGPKAVASQDAGILVLKPEKSGASLPNPGQYPQWHSCHVPHCGIVTTMD